MSIGTCMRGMYQAAVNNNAPVQKELYDLQGALLRCLHISSRLTNEYMNERLNEPARCVCV